MPNSKKRKVTNYQRIQARNRKDALRKKTYDAVRDIYAAADPARQQYPPTVRGESKDFKPHPMQARLVSEAATFVPVRDLRPGQRVRTGNGRLYEMTERDGLRRVREARPKVGRQEETRAAA